MKFFLGLFLTVFSCFAMIGAERAASCLQRHSIVGNGHVACEAYIPSWSYNAEENICVRFIYGGCGGNANRFASQEACEKACKMLTVKQNMKRRLALYGNK